MAEFGVTEKGFVKKRLYDILNDITSDLSTVRDPATGETLTPDLENEDDPLVQIINSTADQISVCWDTLEMCYHQFNPMGAVGNGLAALVQLNGLTKRVGEEDTQLRIRQQITTSRTAKSQVDSIFAAVIEVPGVVFCRIHQNITLAVDANGIPGKTLAIVVVGGDDQAIVDAIFNTAPCISQYHGTTQKTCYDVNDSPYLVKFTRPVAVPIKIEVNTIITDTAAWPVNGLDAIKANLVKYADYGIGARTGIPPGTNVMVTRLYSPANDVPGHNITNIRLAKGVNAFAAQDITIAWNEVATFAIDDITVVTS